MNRPEIPRCPTCGQPDITFDLLTEDDEPEPFGFRCADCGLTLTECECAIERDAKENWL